MIRELTCSMAGVVAQARVGLQDVEGVQLGVVLGATFYSTSDVLRTCYPFVDNREQDAFKLWLMSRTCSQVDSCWPGIERVAGALIERDTLTGDEIRAMVNAQSSRSFWADLRPGADATIEAVSPGPEQYAEEDLLKYMASARNSQ